MASDTVAVSRHSGVVDCDTRNALHVGWYELHPDVSLNFQLSRWAATGGLAWVADVRPVLGALGGLNAWRDTFVQLGEGAIAEGRILHAALDRFPSSVANAFSARSLRKRHEHGNG
jgi:hypothetical protein